MKKEKKMCLLTILALVLGSLCSQATEGQGPPDRVLSTIMYVESKGKDGDVGDKHLKKKAFGAAQTRQPCVDDVNKMCGTKYRAEDCLNNRIVTVFMLRNYLKKWATKERLGHAPTDEDYARIWNGGPGGWKSAATLPYLAKYREAVAVLSKHKTISPLLAVN